MFELKIYGENDKVVKTYSTSVIKYGVIEDAIMLTQKLEGKSELEQFSLIKPLVKGLFVGLTDEELKNSDYREVIGVFNKLTEKATDGLEDDGKNA